MPTPTHTPLKIKTTLSCLCRYKTKTFVRTYFKIKIKLLCQIILSQFFTIQHMDFFFLFSFYCSLMATLKFTSKLVFLFLLPMDNQNKDFSNFRSHSQPAYRFYSRQGTPYKPNSLLSLSILE